MKYFEEMLRDLPSGKKTLINSWKHRLVNPNYKVMLLYRKGKFLSQSNYKLFRIYSSILRTKLIFKRNVEISYKAEIGNKFTLAHPLGVVIGAGIIIKDNVTIFQNVTLGSHGNNRNSKKQYPIIENNVIIYAGAVVIGNVVIGANSIVGANTFVNMHVPPNSIAIGNPCKIIFKK